MLLRIMKRRVILDYSWVLNPMTIVLIRERQTASLTAPRA